MPSWNWNIHSPFIMTLALGLTLKYILKYKLRWAIPVKKTNRGVIEDTLIWKIPPNLSKSFYFTLWKFQTKQKSTPVNFTKLCYQSVLHPLKILRPKSETPINSTCYFFDTPGNSVSSTLTLLFFSLEQPINQSSNIKSSVV